MLHGVASVRVANNNFNSSIINTMMLKQITYTDSTILNPVTINFSDVTIHDVKFLLRVDYSDCTPDSIYIEYIK